MTNRQAQAVETRNQLLAASRTVFSERGYGGATIALITEAATTAHGTFYLHFKNKEDVFVHVMADVLDDIYLHSFTSLEGDAATVPTGMLRERIAAFLRTCQVNARLWRAILEGSIASPAIERAWLDGRERFHREVADRIAVMRDLGLTRELDPRITADALCSMLEWFSFTGLSFDVAEPLEITDEVLDNLMSIWLHSVRPEA